MLFYLDPVVMVTVTPSASRVLDTPPYNNLSLTCEVLAPSNLRVKPDLIWKLDGKAINRTDHMISGINITQNKTRSELVITGLTSSGDYEYRCVAALHIGSDPVREYSTATVITVSGK